jgi:hypothetical protein
MDETVDRGCAKSFNEGSAEVSALMSGAQQHRTKCRENGVAAPNSCGHLSCVEEVATDEMEARIFTRDLFRSAGKGSDLMTLIKSRSEEKTANAAGRSKNGESHIRESPIVG